MEPTTHNIATTSHTTAAPSSGKRLSKSTSTVENKKINSPALTPRRNNKMSADLGVMGAPRRPVPRRPVLRRALASACFGQEGLCLDNNTHNAAAREFFVLVGKSRHNKNVAPTFDPLEGRNGRDRATNRCSLDVIEMDPHGHRGRPLRHEWCHRGEADLLTPCKDPRCRQNRHFASTKRSGGVGVAHNTQCSGLSPRFDRHLGTIRHTSPLNDDLGGTTAFAVALQQPRRIVIDQSLLENTLTTATARGGEFAEIFVEDRQSSGALLDDDRIEELSSGRSRGAGIRVLVGDSTGFAHTADLSEAGLTAAAQAAADAARDGNGGVTTVDLSSQSFASPSPIKVLPEGVAKQRKVELLNLANDAARGVGDSISQVSVGYGDVRRRIQIANSDGLLTGDDQVKTRFSVSCVAMGDAGMQTGRESIGHTMGFELFDQYDVTDLARKAAERAITKLRARPAPSGAVTTVIGKGGGGVLFHEACGHGLEADHVAKQATVFAGRVGELVASPLVTLIDDGTMAHEWGAYAVDDEGRPAQRNVLHRRRRAHRLHVGRTSGPR